MQKRATNPPTMVYSVTEVTVITGKRSSISIFVDDKKVTIPVSSEVKAYFDQQFCRDKPTPLQKQKYATIMNLLRAAYLQGKKDGAAEP